MNKIPELVLDMKQMRRAMYPFVLVLYEVVKESKADNILEIGVRQGQSTRTILSALEESKKGKLVSIDLGDRIDRIPKELLSYWIQIIGNSHEGETLKKIPQKEYDILLIDGDHSYEGVKQDFEMYAPLVKKGGLIFFHDIINQNCGVPKFWNELRLPNKVALNYGVAGMGLIQV